MFGQYIHEEHQAIISINGKVRVPKQIVIYAITEEAAQNAVDLISAASCLINEDCGDDSVYDKCRAYKASKKRTKTNIFEDLIPPTKTGEFQFACMVAAQTSRRKSTQYALYKYRLSQQSFSTYIHDLEPTKWYPQKFVFNSAEHHVRCAQAISLGYSIIEELGLEIRANQQNPSFIKGKWNLIVKEELEKRLIKAGVNLTEKALWSMRDTPTQIERKRYIPVIKKATWAYSKVRDGEIEVIDAIAHASWLRSKVSAHKLNSISSSLNYYDVSNIHYLSRRLLMEVLGLWRFHDFLYPEYER